MMPGTLTYYELNAERFVLETADVDMSALHDRFLAQIPAGGLILDAGCGSGRDSKAFLARGYAVHAFDASPEIARIASRQIGQAVEVATFDGFSDARSFDGIWACASLLHVSGQALPGVLQRLWGRLKPGGVLYASFKLGDGERAVEGRHFTDATEDHLRGWLAGIGDIDTLECWTTPDQRPERPGYWLNALVRRTSVASRRLFTGDPKHPFLPQLLAAIAHADEIDLAVAFVKTTGLRLLLPALHAALGDDETRSRPPARVRIVTSDYLDVTDPEALRLLLLLQAQGASVRVFEAAGSSGFHMKAYLFARIGAGRLVQGSAFIGSSNISRQALTDGLEWNYRVDYPGDAGFLEARARFDEVFGELRTRPLSDDWIEAYEARRTQLQRPVAPGSAETELPPDPSPLQREALAALAGSRREGYRRGLVVMATGLGKTWLAAFDAEQAGARRVLFVAHREEILNQAAETFLRIRPRARIGFYRAQQRDGEVDLLFASVQTLGRAAHLERFARQHFDYVVIDEFHHAAAPTYRLLLHHFAPQFLLGLTATPDRTDQSDLLSLCDDNLVFSRNLFDGIQAKLLAPFHYYGIWDSEVDYREIPWRNGRFDPEQLSSKLATLARARHALKQWRGKAQRRTLAFCVSVRHADYMAAQFQREGIAAASVHAESALSRGEALAQLADGRLAIVFSVDLFNEGVDLPGIDTVLMLRPTESKILFLQQLGRGLRLADGKTHLVVLDFIGNHHSFLHKPQALAQCGSSYRKLAEFARKVESQRLELPDGCFVNYDLALIDFMKGLDGDGVSKDYSALHAALGRRPTLTEFYRSGSNLQRMRREYGSWFELVASMDDDLQPEERAVVSAHRDFLREVETGAMTRSFKMVLLEAFQTLDGWQRPPSLATLAGASWAILQRRRPLLADLPEDMLKLADGASPDWQRYWRGNPVNAWIGANQGAAARAFFRLTADHFEPRFEVAPEHVEALSALVQELVDYRLAAYEVRRTASARGDNVVPIQRRQLERTELPFFPNLKIACGHFRSARADAEEHRAIGSGSGYGRLDPARHFIARASGNSMNGGKHPIRDGDYLLLEHISPGSAGSITGSTVAIERQDAGGDDQYLLRVVTKNRDGSYVLVANNPDYEDIFVTPEMATELRTLARLKAVIDPLELAVGQSFMREDIPALFGEAFNPGNWHAGHVVLPEQKAHVLLVTLNKQGKAEDQRYIDHWIDAHTFHWQSQNQTTPDGKRGRELIDHASVGVGVHLFVRDQKLAAGKAAPFTYHGRVRYVRHTGSAPMSVVFAVEG